MNTDQWFVSPDTSPQPTYCKVEAEGVLDVIPLVIEKLLQTPAGQTHG